mgnify:CR=1 FL=1
MISKSAAAGLARADVAAQQAALRAAQIDLARTTVRAPISGRIGRSIVTTGALVTYVLIERAVTSGRLTPAALAITTAAFTLGIQPTGLIAVAAGAGGHAGQQSPFALIQEIRAWFQGPLLLSGAIATGRAVLAARAMGADLAYIGSPFIATAEANAVEGYKQMIVDSGADDIVNSSLFTGIHGNYLKPSIRNAGMDPDARGQLRHWRIGPSSQPPDDESYRARSLVAAGAGLRPLSPCHLALKDREVTWVRRTRTGGDGWDAPEVPLGETAERYEVTVVQGSAVLHRVETTVPRWTVPDAVWSNAVAGNSFAIAVAQLSDVYGPGPSARRIIHVGTDHPALRAAAVAARAGPEARDRQRGADAA